MGVNFCYEGLYFIVLIGVTTIKYCFLGFSWVLEMVILTSVVSSFIERKGRASLYKFKTQVYQVKKALSKGLSIVWLKVFRPFNHQ